MLIAFVAYLVLVIWGLKEAEIYGSEAAVHFVIFGLCLAGFLLGNMYWSGRGFWFVVPVCLADVYLLLKLVGNPTM